MPRRIIARVLLCCAVLLAQQTALAHGLWHAAGAQASAGETKSPAGKKLCDLHDLLATVLGAVSAVAPHTSLLSFSDIAFSCVTRSAAQARALVAKSRGPPAVS